MNLQVGQHLFTKDGRKSGNALIVGASYDLYSVETDFGNTSTLNELEVEEFYHTTGRDGRPHITTPEKWRADKRQ